MKFTILDSVVPEHPDNNTYSDTYKYLDEFLDDTFIMKYFTMREHSRRDGDGEHEK
jgi:hypothetical protein